jgi:hypothetical protein
MKKVLLIAVLILSLTMYSSSFDFQKESQKANAEIVVLPFGVVNMFALSAGYTIGFDTGYDILGYTTPIIYLGGNIWYEKAGLLGGGVNYSSYGPGVTAEVVFPFKNFSFDILENTFYPSLKLGMKVNYFFEKVSSRFWSPFNQENGGLGINFNYLIQVSSFEKKEFDISWIFWPFPLIIGAEILF